MTRCPEAPNWQGHMSGSIDPAYPWPGPLGHHRAICRWCHQMIRLDTSQGSRWVLDSVVIEEVPW